MSTPRYGCLRSDRARASVQAVLSHFGEGNCSRLVLDALRRATPPLTTREITERLLAGKRTGATNSGDQDALHKTVLAALKVGRNKGLIERTGSGRGVAASWRIAR